MPEPEPVDPDEWEAQSDWTERPTPALVLLVGCCLAIPFLVIENGWILAVLLTIPAAYLFLNVRNLAVIGYRWKADRRRPLTLDDAFRSTVRNLHRSGPGATITFLAESEFVPMAAACADLTETTTCGDTAFGRRRWRLTDAQT